MDPRYYFNIHSGYTMLHDATQAGWVSIVQVSPGRYLKRTMETDLVKIEAELRKDGGDLKKISRSDFLHQFQMTWSAMNKEYNSM